MPIQNPHNSEFSPMADRRDFGVGSSWDVVVADRTDRREWLSEAKQCQLLAQHHITHAGWVSGTAGMEISRQRPSGSYVMVTLEGNGEALIDGTWRTVEPGHAVLLPPFTPNMLRSPNKPWKFCWVRYLEPPGQMPVVSADSPVCRAAGNLGLYHSVCGLIDASRQDTDPATQSIWVDTVIQHVKQITRPIGRDSRLTQLWSVVQEKLAHPWTLEELADQAHVSTEHLRRLCRRDMGRSPMQHLIYLRMRAAQELLRESNDTIEAICNAVGYQQPFTFSNTFQKWIGVRPSAIRPKS